MNVKTEPRSAIETGLIVAVGIALIMLLALVGIVAVPGLVGGDDAFIVTSGSMSPTIETGDVIVTQEVDPAAVESGDIVTVHDGSGGETGYVTHRVVDIVEADDERYFELKGDANDEPDEGLVPAEYMQGETHLHLPYLGYLLLFARSSLGLFVLVVGPGFALVATGSWQLLREFGYRPANKGILESVLGPESGGEDGNGESTSSESESVGGDEDELEASVPSEVLPTDRSTPEAETEESEAADATGQSISENGIDEGNMSDRGSGQ